MNYIKDVALKNEDGTYNMIVEIEKFSKSKTELVEGSFDKLVEVRKVKGRYPYYYGCMPRTLAGDRDPLDVILFSNKKHKKADVVKIKVVGVIKAVDNGEEDDKIIAVVADEKHNNLSFDMAIAMHFLKTYKGKKADMIIDKTAKLEDEAKQIIETAHANFMNAPAGTFTRRGRHITKSF